jgi:oligopeptide transport system ATP-binding protein
MRIVVDQVGKQYAGPDGSPVTALENICLRIEEEEFVVLVGPSGCGKSTLLNMVGGLLAPSCGRIFVEGLAEDRDPSVGMVFQEVGLFPWRTVRENIGFGLEEAALSPEEQQDRIRYHIELVGLAGFENSYPHQLSGGMRQRVVIAIALACDPDILICDEPTTALDVTIQWKFLELIKKLQAEKNLTVVYITHDLGVVAKVADFVCVLYAGRIIETGSIEEIYYDPRHPYTWGLLSSLPDLSTDSDRLFAIPGNPVNLLHKIKGDPFAPRNPYALKIDFEEEPPLFDVGGTHKVASWLCHPDAPKVAMPESLRIKIDRMIQEEG